MAEAAAAGDGGNPAERLAADRLLAGLARGEPPHLVLMHVLGDCPDEATARRGVELARARASAHQAEGVSAVAAAWKARPEAWGTVRTVLSVALDDSLGAEPLATGPAPSNDAAGERAAEHSLRRWRTAFDRIAERHPEAGVALYALGDPALLAAASREIVQALADWGDLRPGQRVLDLGCGIGRLSGPMAEMGAIVLGVDISFGMLADAGRRHGGPGRLFAQVSGRDLRALADECLDLVVAADVFPYLVDAGEAVAAGHLAEIARVLRPGGRLVIANVSYRGDEARDASDLARWADATGLRVLEPLRRPFALWDGLVARLARR